MKCNSEEHKNKSNREVTLTQFAKELIGLSIDCAFDFSCDDDDNHAVHFGVTKIERFDTVVLLFSKYGGGLSACCEMDDIDSYNLEEFLKYYLDDYYEEYIYIDDTQYQKELWGVTFEFEDIDGEKFRHLAVTDSPFFDSKEKAQQWIVDHPYNDFDENFDNDYCSNPHPVLLDRWEIRKDGKCIRHI